MSQIAINDKDLEILEYISRIQNTVRIQKNMSHYNDSMTIVVDAELDVPENAALTIFKLDDFIKLLKHFSNNGSTTLSIDKNDMILLSKGGTKVKYNQCNESFIQKKQEFKDLEFDVEFNLPGTAISEINKLQKILGTDTIYFRIDKNTVYIGTCNSENVTASTSEIVMDEKIEAEDGTYPLSEFSFLPNDDYKVSLSTAGLVKLQATSSKSMFYVTLKDDQAESDSE